MIQLLKFEDYREMPWKNGQGSTIELARDAGQDLQQFLWRISMADVRHDGPFSFFPARQRMLSVLDGEGIVLTFAHTAVQQKLTAESVYAFSGEWAVQSKLIAGPIRDFNLIYSTEHFHARMQKYSALTAGLSFTSSANVILIYNHTAALTIEIDQQIYQLQPMQSIKIEKNTGESRVFIAQNMHFYGVIVELYSK